MLGPYLTHTHLFTLEELQAVGGGFGAKLWAAPGCPEGLLQSDQPDPQASGVAVAVGKQGGPVRRGWDTPLEPRPKTGNLKKQDTFYPIGTTFKWGT